MSDYIVEVKVRNGPLVRAMRAKGYENGLQLAKATGVSYAQINCFLNLKRPPILQSGRMAAAVTILSEALDVPWEQLFPVAHHQNALAKNKAEITLSAVQIQELIGSDDVSDPEQLLIEHDRAEAAKQALMTLSPREERVLRLHFGLDGSDSKTGTEISEILGFSKSRASQIIERALKKLGRGAALNVLVRGGVEEAKEKINRERLTIAKEQEISRAHIKAELNISDEERKARLIAAEKRWQEELRERHRWEREQVDERARALGIHVKS